MVLKYTENNLVWKQDKLKHDIPFWGSICNVQDSRKNLLEVVGAAPPPCPKV